MERRERIVLASASPRRRELLRQIGIEAEIVPSRLEEQMEGGTPEQVVKRLSAQKAAEAAGRCTFPCLVIGADTVVAAAGEILGKPASGEDAARMIRMLEGDTHQVYTGVTLVLKREGGTQTVTFAEKTEVEVYPMSGEEIEGYVRSGEPLDKAGAYGIQGKFAAFIKGIDGDYSNVVGLPVGRVYQEIKRLFEEQEGEK